MVLPLQPQLQISVQAAVLTLHQSHRPVQEKLPIKCEGSEPSPNPSGVTGAMASNAMRKYGAELLGTLRWSLSGSEARCSQAMK